MRRLSPTPFVLLLVACGGAESEPPTSTSTSRLVAADFCPAYARAICATRAACACTPLEACAQENVLACERGILTPDTMIAIDYGGIEFDAERAAALIDSIESARDSCGSAFDALAWTHGDLLDFGGMLRGRLESGARCSIPHRTLGPNECDEGVCLDRDGDSAYHCVSVVTPGASCAADDLCMDRAEPLGLEITRHDLVFIPCSEGACRERRSLDDACKSDAWCSSYNCERPFSETNLVEVRVDLDEDNLGLREPFDPDDLGVYHHSVSFEVLDIEGVTRTAELYLLQLGQREWLYRSMMDAEVLALGVLVFGDHGALDAAYTLGEGVTFETSSPLVFDFSDTRLERDGFRVHRVQGDHQIGRGFCAPPRKVDRPCQHDSQCASGVCNGRCVAPDPGPEAPWCG